MKTLSIILTVILLHTQLAFAAGCDLPRFGGARLFGGINTTPIMATADLNQDGFPDVVLAGPYRDATNKPQTGISVSLNNGDGTFQPPVYYATSPTTGTDAFTSSTSATTSVGSSGLSGPTSPRRMVGLRGRPRRTAPSPGVLPAVD